MGVKCFWVDIEDDNHAPLTPGAMFYGFPTWVAALVERQEPHRFHFGPDGKHLVVVLPNGDHWHIDSRASNCTLPDDNEHRCWIRHGEPPNITVDKNGNSCGCGCSIESTTYHGFLRNGEFVDC